MSGRSDDSLTSERKSRGAELQPVPGHSCYHRKMEKTVDIETHQNVTISKRSKVLGGPLGAKQGELAPGE